MFVKFTTVLSIVLVCLFGLIYIFPEQILALKDYRKELLLFLQLVFILTGFGIYTLLFYFIYNFKKE
jgi:hypothetical protein